LAGAFDAQFSEYRHHIDKLWDGPESVEFGGRVQFKIDDGMIVETPFFNRFFNPDGQNKSLGLCPGRPRGASREVLAAPLQFGQIGLKRLMAGGLHLG